MGVKQILRMQKLKSAYSVSRSLKHAFREQETPNADSSFSSLNQHLGASSGGEAMNKYKELLATQKTVRKNAVHVVEFLITASPEFFTGENRSGARYFNDALDFLRAKHGSENVFYAGVHYDEKTPHMYAYVVPRDEFGKLNCRHFYGEKDALSKLQDDFHEKVASQFGLERGLKGSKANHKTIKKYYTELNQAKKGELPEPSKFDHLLAAVGLSKTASERYLKAFNGAARLRDELDRLGALREQERSSMAQENCKLASKLEDAKKDLSEIDKLKADLLEKHERIDRIGMELAMSNGSEVVEMKEKIERLESELGRFARDYEALLEEKQSLVEELYQSQSSTLKRSPS